MHANLSPRPARPGRAGTDRVLASRLACDIQHALQIEHRWWRSNTWRYMRVCCIASTVLYCNTYYDLLWLSCTEAEAHDLLWLSAQKRGYETRLPAQQPR